MNSKPNVILIVADALRADHLSSYGYHRKTSPNIDKLAQQGVLFESAFSAATWSPPSHASIFTGKYPSYHKTVGTNIYLNRGNTTIAEILRSNGYKTRGISNCALLAPKFGFQKGFEMLVNPSEIFFRSLKTRAREVSFILESLYYGPKDFIKTIVSGPDEYSYRTNEMIKAFLRGHRSTARPFFLFINYFDCHAPYDPPAPFKKRFCRGFREPKLHIMDFLLQKVFGGTGQRISGSDLDMKKLRYIAGGSVKAVFLIWQGDYQSPIVSGI